MELAFLQVERPCLSARSITPRGWRPAPALGRTSAPPPTFQTVRACAIAGIAFAASRVGRQRVARKAAKGKSVIVWHRTDLRVDDNPLLAQAAELVKEGSVKQVLPVYILDPKQFGLTAFGSDKTGAFRAKFLLQCIADFKKRLRSIGSELLVRVGEPEKMIADLADDIDAKIVLTEQQVTDEELKADERVRSTLKPMRADLYEIWGNTLYHIDDLPFSSPSAIPKVFTPFKEKCAKGCKPSVALDAPTKDSLPLPQDVGGLDFVPGWNDLPCNGRLQDPASVPHSAFTIEGGETAARARLKHYLWDTDAIADYFNVRNGMLGTEYSTKFSASLAFGCISARRISNEIARYEKTRTKNKSTYWVIFELVWRDFFRFSAKRYGNKIFHLNGPSPPRPPMTWTTDLKALQRWKDGTTGWPLVDANMRELKETGFMSNRGRQNVASYLTLDLGLDWRLGADHFESLLVDYDVCSNWGNWVAAAGLTGGRVNKFNMIKQSKDYDPKGEYVRMWVPELRGLEGAAALEPWKHGKHCGNYPKRLTEQGVQRGKVGANALEFMSNLNRARDSPAPASSEEPGDSEEPAIRKPSESLKTFGKPKKSRLSRPKGN